MPILHRTARRLPRPLPGPLPGRLGGLLLCALLAAACGDRGSAGSGRGPGSGDEIPAEALLADPSVCPGAYAVDRAPQTGLNDDFAVGERSGKRARRFHLWLPDAARFTGPRPLFVALTGTVQEEASFVRQSGLDVLTEDGWIVVAPVRAGTGPDDPDRAGIVWWPWDDLRTAAQRGTPNPDLDFFDALVPCLGAHLSVDRNRIYVGGISAGGTMTHRVLQSRPDLFAGGVAFSGNFSSGAISVEPDQPEPLQNRLVVVVWGGPNDRYCAFGAYPDCLYEVDYFAETRHAADFYAARDAELVTCSTGADSDFADLPSGGHYWRPWSTAHLSRILLAHPKGSTRPLIVPEPSARPPFEWGCAAGAFADP